MLSIRKKGRYYTVRGTVRVGRETRTVAEHSTGTDRRNDAQEYASKLEEKIRETVLYPERERQRGITFGNCVDQYLKRGENIRYTRLKQIEELLKYMEDASIEEIKTRFKVFVQNRCKNLKPATINHYLATLKAILNFASDTYGFKVPKIPPQKENNKLVRFLSLRQQVALLHYYPSFVRALFFIYCYEGARSQEGMQLLWEDISFERKQITFTRTKNGKIRTVPMHPKVRRELLKLWYKREKPRAGHIFLNARGHPYPDTRDIFGARSNPLTCIHKTALRRANDYLLRKGIPLIKSFRIHDWRHHFASRATMEGIDRQTIMRIGGWSSSAMLDRYADVSTEHLQESIKKLA